MICVSQLGCLRCSSLALLRRQREPGFRSSCASGAWESLARSVRIPVSLFPQIPFTQLFVHQLVELAQRAFSTVELLQVTLPCAADSARQFVPPRTASSSSGDRRSSKGPCSMMWTSPGT